MIDAELNNCIGEVCEDYCQYKSKILSLICAIDDRINLQLNQIIEHPKFKALEASWLGLFDFICHAHGVRNLKVRLLNYNWNSISKDLNGFSDIKNSYLYDVIGRKEVEVLGGEPFGVVLIDHYLRETLDYDYDDFYTASLLSDLGNLCQCPILIGLTPNFFNNVTGEEFADLEKLDRILEGDEFISWRNLRNHRNAQYLALLWPSFLLRERYEDMPIKGTTFHQRACDSQGLYGHLGYLFLRSIVNEYKNLAWFGFLKLIGNVSDRGAILSKTKNFRERGYYRLTVSQGEFFSEKGIIPICESTKSGELYFYGNRSTLDCGTSTELKIISQIQTILIVCRVVNYVRVQARNLIGSLKTADECELHLNNWIDNYCAPVSEAGAEMLAKYPLRRARVKLFKKSSDANSYHCEVTIQPQYQIDYIHGEIKIAANLEARGR